MSARAPAAIVVGLAVALCVVMLGADAAFACPVCGGGKAENDWAFGLTTLLLSLLPPALFGGVVFYFVRAHRRASRSENVSTPD